MVGKAPVPKTLANSAQVSPLEEERRAALAISGLIGRVDDSVLWIVIKIFAAARDKRVKRGGCLFLAHLLRFATLVQLSLFQGTEISDAARIALPNILKFCQDKSNAWPWCYDTTLKYLNLLVAAGVLVTRPDEPGIYYLPLGAYVLLPEHAVRQVEKLTGKRSKVSRSAAFKRTAVHCTLLNDGMPVEDAWMVDSPKGTLLIDELEMQRMVQALGTALQSCQGVALLPATMVEVIRVVAKHAPRVLKKDGRLSSTRSRAEVLQLLQATRNLGGEQGRDNVIYSASRETTVADLSATQSRGDSRENLRPGRGIKRESSGESTNTAANLPVAGKLVDSRAAVLTDITSFTISKDSLSENILSESAQAREGNSGQESTILAESPRIVDSSSAGEGKGGSPVSMPPHPQGDPFSLASLLYWRFPVEDRELQLGFTEKSQLAALLSDRFERNQSRVRHYIARLGEDPRALDIAVVDGLVRSHFPDKRHNPDELKGPWVTKMYQAYRGGEPTEPEILAWSDTTYTYDAIKAVLTEAARWLEAQGRPRRRPRPEEVIVDSEQLEDSYFWANDAGQGLKSEGWAGVDVDGDLMTCDEYEQHRLLLLQRKLATESRSRALSPEVEVEFLAYHAWTLPWACSVEEENQLRKNLPDELLDNLEALGGVLDHDRYAVEVGITPFSRKRVVVVSSSDDFRQVWLLRDGSDFQAFEQLCRQSQQEGKEGEPSAGRGWRSGDDAAVLPEEQPDRQAASGESREAQPDLQVGPYQVSFDASGATIEVKCEGTTVRYRIEAPSATNATDFIRTHREAVIAMANDRPRGLEAFRVEGQPENEHPSEKRDERTDG